MNWALKIFPFGQYLAAKLIENREIRAIKGGFERISGGSKNERGVAS